MSQENNKLTIYSYQKLWRWKMKIYALSRDLPLPRALPVRFALYFLGSSLFTTIFYKIPFLYNVPFAIKLMTAVGLTKFLDSVKLDGKNPILFILGWFRFLLLEQGSSIEHFKSYDSQLHNIKLSWSSGSIEPKDSWKDLKPVRLHWTGGTTR